MYLCKAHLTSEVRLLGRVGTRRAIATPGGMTAAGVDVLEAGGLRAALAGAVAAAVERARGVR